MSKLEARKSGSFKVGKGRKEYRDGVGNDDRIGVKDLLEM